MYSTLYIQYANVLNKKEEKEKFHESAADPDLFKVYTIIFVSGSGSEVRIHPQRQCFSSNLKLQA